MTRTTLASWGVVVLCAAAGLGQAQPPATYYPRVHPGQTELPPGVDPVPYNHTWRPLRDLVKTGRPLGCWASFNGYTCSSLPSTWTFVFGSCRDFYGEPCLKTAPPSPLPPYAEGDGGRMPPRPKTDNGLYPKRGGWLFGRGGDDGSSCRGCARP